jgi:hypothetical protein
MIAPLEWIKYLICKSVLNHIYYTASEITFSDKKNQIFFSKDLSK